MGVASEEMRAHLKLNGVPVDWTSLTHQYRNIGDSQPSAARQLQNDLREAAVVNNAQATKEEFDCVLFWLSLRDFILSAIMLPPLSESMLQQSKRYYIIIKTI